MQRTAVRVSVANLRSDFISLQARSSCLSAAIISEALRPGVIQLATGAWFDPWPGEAAGLMCVHGNPNVLTRDVGTSSLAQGCIGQLTSVEVELFKGELPPIRAFNPPVDAEAPR